MRGKTELSKVQDATQSLSGADLKTLDAGALKAAFASKRSSKIQAKTRLAGYECGACVGDAPRAFRRLVDPTRGQEDLPSD